MAEEKKKGLNLSGKMASSRKPSGDTVTPAASSHSTSLRATSRTAVVDPDEDEDEDDDILSDVDTDGSGKSKWLFIVVGVVVVVAIIIAFLLFGGKKTTPPPVDTGSVTPAQQGQNQTPSSTQQTPTPGEPVAPVGVGTQDFTGNTTMSNSDVLTDPDKYLEDIYGLTTRVDYTVSSISNVADFVSYEKHRGTWGGGLELYWLDVEYKNNNYVIQVPFKYYKELDDIGIVPVKMEVLSIQGVSSSETLTVISYMSLDEETLKDILKQQAKSK